LVNKRTTDRRSERSSVPGFQRALSNQRETSRSKGGRSLYLASMQSFGNAVCLLLLFTNTMIRAVPSYRSLLAMLKQHLCRIDSNYKTFDFVREIIEKRSQKESTTVGYETNATKNSDVVIKPT
jgi:hypothetical protein